MSLTRACSRFGCGQTKPCPIHSAKKERRAKEKTAHERGYNWRWRTYRETWLTKHPLCGDREHKSSGEHSLCVAEGRAVGLGARKMHVDHIVPHKGDRTLFWSAANHQTLCEPCHNRKTATEDGGFVKAIPGERFVVTGPPGCGKTTWVEQRARPGDVVFDLDAVAAVVTRVPKFPRPKDATRALLAMRDGLIGWLQEAGTLVHVYVIVTDEHEAKDIAAKIRARVIQPRFSKALNL